jgi:hypothetical protein
MKRAMSLIFVLAPGLLFAQGAVPMPGRIPDRAHPLPASSAVSAAPAVEAPPPEGVLVNRPGSLVGSSPAVQQTPAPPAVRPVPRRPSMVGYVGDSTITSQVRMRFDAGLHTPVPDRAEFFYGKCGCYRTLPVTDPAYDSDAAGPGPGLVTDLNFQQFYIQGEYAFGPRGSIFAELPVRMLRPQTFAPGTGSFSDTNGNWDLGYGVRPRCFRRRNGS